MDIPCEAELDQYERLAVSDHSQVHHALAKMILLVRHLQHELADPNYLYASQRICRQALIYRQAEIDRLNRELSELKEFPSGK